MNNYKFINNYNKISNNVKITPPPKITIMGGYVLFQTSSKIAR